MSNNHAESDLRSAIAAARLGWAEVYRAAVSGDDVPKAGPKSFAAILGHAEQSLALAEQSREAAFDRERCRLFWYRALWDSLLSDGVEGASGLLATGCALLSAGWRLKDVLTHLGIGSGPAVPVLVTGA